jgi:hypothetical protein
LPKAQRPHILVSNDFAYPPTRKAFADYIEHGLRSVVRGTRRVYVYSKPDEDLTASPRRVLRRMHIGDSAFFPVPAEGVRVFRARVTSAARRQGCTITTQGDIMDGIPGMRVWRLS